MVSKRKGRSKQNTESEDNSVSLDVLADRLKEQFDSIKAYIDHKLTSLDRSSNESQETVSNTLVIQPRQNTIDEVEIENSTNSANNDNDNSSMPHIAHSSSRHQIHYPSAPDLIYDGSHKHNIDDFFDQYIILMQAWDIPESCWGSHLGIHLRKEPQKTWLEIKNKTFIEMKKELSEKYGDKTRELQFSEEFRAVKIDKNENVSTFWARLNRLSHRANPELTELEHNLLVKMKFIDCQPYDVRAKIKSLKLTKSDEIIEVADRSDTKKKMESKEKQLEQSLSRKGFEDSYSVDCVGSPYTIHSNNNTYIPQSQDVAVIRTQKPRSGQNWKSGVMNRANFRKYCSYHKTHSHNDSECFVQRRLVQQSSSAHVLGNQNTQQQQNNQKQGTSRVFSSKFAIRCWNCGQFGHVQRFCRYPPSINHVADLVMDDTEAESLQFDKSGQVNEGEHKINTFQDNEGEIIGNPVQLNS